MVMGAQHRSARVARGVLCVCVILALIERSGGANTKQKKDAPPDELKLNSIKAHERNLQTDPPPFEVRALFEELHKEEAACVEKLGRGALSDGKGGCHCYALEYRMDNGTCVEYKHSSQALPEKEEELGLEVRLKGLSVCYHAKACSKLLTQRAESIDTELRDCSSRDAWLGGQVALLNETVGRDLTSRSSAAEAVQTWIKDLRAENQKMISELRKYTVLTEENKRLKGDLQRMKGERARLDAAADTLKDDLQEAKRTREEAAAEVGEEAAKCDATVQALRRGLAAVGLPAPSL